MPPCDLRHGNRGTSTVRTARYLDTAALAISSNAVTILVQAVKRSIVFAYHRKKSLMCLPAPEFYHTSLFFCACFSQFLSLRPHWFLFVVTRGIYLIGSVRGAGKRRLDHLPALCRPHHRPADALPRRGPALVSSALKVSLLEELSTPRPQ